MVCFHRNLFTAVLLCLLDNRAFGTACCREHDSGREADAQIVLVEAQQVSTVLQRLAGLILEATTT